MRATNGICQKTIGYPYNHRYPIERLGTIHNGVTPMEKLEDNINLCGHARTRNQSIGGSDGLCFGV